MHGVSKTITCDRDFKCVSKFWESLQCALGTHLRLTTFHPQTEGQHTIQTLEDTLRCCVLSWQGSWEDHMPLVEFAYNNSYQASIRMTPYEALYWKKV
jgi:hypothetical protein